MKRWYLVTLVCGSLLAVALPASARKWTSADGQYSVEAELVEFADGKVTLQKAEGETITIAVKSLSEADRRFLATTKKKSAAPKNSGASYVADVQPFLATYCAECHNQNKAKAGYAVDTFSSLTQASRHGSLVVPGKPAESRLMLTLQGRGKPMPPRKSPQPTAQEVAKVAAWIEAGAQDDTGQPAKAEAHAAKSTPKPRH